jgi:glycosyltransferase involved in cell wall biosynthesis
MRKKVVFVTANLGYGGAQRVMVTLFNHLDRTLFDPYFVSFQGDGPNLQYIDSPERVVNLNVSRVRFGLHKLVREIRKLTPHVVVSTLGYLNLALILAKPLLPRKTKLLLREGTIPSVHFSQNVSHPRIWRWLYRNFYTKADGVICQSDYMLDDLAEYLRIPRDKMVRIYNPVDVDRIKELAGKSPNPYQGDGPQLLAIGRLAAEKRYDLMLKACVEVRNVFPEAKLTILGSGLAERTLRVQCDQLGVAGSVHWVGFQSNPYPYLRHAALLVLCSRYEGLPNVVLEALALGTPVVAVDCPGGLREIAEKTERLKLVASDGPTRLAEGIIKALEAKEWQGRGQIEPAFYDRFGIKSVVAQYEELIQRVSDAGPF